MLNNNHNATFKAEKRTILVERVAKQIRKAIVCGNLKPADRLIETELANDMQISRNVVREAIRYLEKEGLVTATPFKGAKVREFTKKDLDDLYDLRIVLEELAIRTLIKNLDNEKITKLDSIVATWKQLTTESTVEEIIDADTIFHKTICELSGNWRLLDAWMNISYQLRAVLTLDYYLHDYDTPEKMLSPHYPVLEAIKRGDAKESVKLMREIILEAQKKASEFYGGHISREDFPGLARER